MTLNEFLSKAGQLFGLVEKNLTAEQALANIKTELSAAQADLGTAKASIASLTGENEKLSASVTDLTGKLDAKTKELAAAESKLADPSAQIKEAASREALKITAGQGQPPLASAPAAEQTGDILTQYKAIKDSTQKTVFYRKNKAAIDAAYKALPQSE